MMIGRKIALDYSGRVGGMLFSSVVVVITARLLGPSIIGTVGFVTSFLGFFAVLLQMGFNVTHVKKISEGNDLGQCMGTFITAKMALIVIYVLVVYIVVHAAGVFLSPVQKKIVFIMVINAVIMFGIADIALKTFEARKETSKVLLVSIVSKLAMLLAVIYVVWQYPTPVGLAMATLAGSISSAFVGYLFLRRLPLSRPTWELFRAYIMFASPVLIATLAGAVIGSTNQFMIGYFVSESEVGYFNVSRSTMRFLEWGSISMTTLLFPVVSSSYGEGKGMKDVGKTIDRSFRYMNMIYWPIMSFVLIFGGVIIAILFGEKFLPAASIFKILVMYCLLVSITRPAAALILGAGYPRLEALAVAITAITLLVFNFILVPSEFMGLKMMGLGAVGAALATVAAFSINAIINYVIAFKVVSYKPPLKFLIYPLFSSFAVALPFYGSGIGSHLLTFSLPLQLVYLMVMCIVFFSAYLGLLALLGEAIKDDLKFFWESFSPKKMFAYVKEESFQKT